MKMLNQLLRRKFSSCIEDALKLQNIGKKLKVQGWVKAVRLQKANSFIDINDGLTKGGQKLQIVCPSQIVPTQLSYHSAVKVEGILRKSDHPSQEVELEAEKIDVLSPITNNSYPFQPRKRYDEEHPRAFPHYRAKLNDFSTMLDIRSSLTKGIHEYFWSKDYRLIQTPVLTSNDCEGAGEVFQVIPANKSISNKMKKENSSIDEAYFDKKVYLTVSGQVHLEAICNGKEKVYTFGPAFRAEMSRTRRHLSEFTMVEAEAAFMDNIEDLLYLQEDLIKTSLKGIVESNYKDIEFYFQQQELQSKKSPKTKINQDIFNHVTKVLDNNFIVMPYKEAFDILEACNEKFQEKPKRFEGLGKEHELYLVEKHCNNVPVFIIDWPKETKAFYARQKTDEIVSACDLLFPSVGELCGGSLREDNYDILKANIEKHNVEGLDWYLDLRCSGAAPSGGFGLGFERLLQFLLKIYNIRDTIPFSRRPHDCKL